MEDKRMQLYFSFIEEDIRKFYNILSERDRRMYAAIEALKIGYGGITYISSITGCSQKTIARGIRELKMLPKDTAIEKYIRLPGGGRKPYHEVHKDIDEQFLDVLKDYTAGDPMNDKVLWTNLTPSEIADKLEEKHAIRVSTTVIQQLLIKHNFKRRKAQKVKTAKTVVNRNDQFENINRLKSEYTDSSNPIISIDTKKKEQIGDFFRAGSLYTIEAIKVHDHDFNSLAKGIAIPHGIYDLKKNTGFINIGTSKDTSEFVGDSIFNWWNHQGKWDYPDATSILILCDSGGSNNCRHYIFKRDIQALVNRIGIEIRIAHYPPYTSKYNPIEHRLFSHVTRACQGVVFKSVELVKELIEKTKTSTGLKVMVKINDKVYQTGRKVSDDFKKNSTIRFDDYLPRWNYYALPMES
jgi:hypothetical protein